MNLSTISTATIANLKSFARANNLLPTGDLRLKSTWLEVVQTFLTAAQEIAQEAFTYFCFKELQTMQSKELMTNSFPIALETQIADDLEIFGSLSDDTARAIDCANADTFCKPTNLADIKSQSTAIAVQTFKQIATYDNAVQAANTLNVVIRRGAKFTLKAMWSVFLVSIALVMLLIEASQNRQKVMLIIREGVENRVKRLVLRYRHLELVGRLALKFTIVQPVLYRRDRVRLIIRNAISN